MTKEHTLKSEYGNLFEIHIIPVVNGLRVNQGPDVIILDKQQAQDLYNLLDEWLDDE